MSDKLRKEFESNTGRRLVWNRSAWAEYATIIESALLRERERVRQLEEETRDVLDLAGGCCCADQYKAMQARGIKKTIRRAVLDKLKNEILADGRRYWERSEIFVIINKLAEGNDVKPM